MEDPSVLKPNQKDTKMGPFIIIIIIYSFFLPERNYPQKSEEYDYRLEQQSLSFSFL
jgi:hypothetical protein